MVTPIATTQHSGDDSATLDFLERGREFRAAWVQGLSTRLRLVHVAVTSALGLYLELLLIRWLESEVRHLAYVKNLPLLGAFLGLGLGFAFSGRRRSTYPLAVVACAVVLGIGVVMGRLRLGDLLAGSALAVGPAGPEAYIPAQETSSPAQLLVFFFIMAGIFASVVVAMIPFGEIAGDLMEGLPALRAYLANLCGALLGIGCFFVLSSLWVPPAAVAALGLAVAIAYQLVQPAVAAVSLGVALAACAGMASLDTYGDVRVAWSPYNKIEVGPMPAMATIDGRSISPGWLLRAQNLYYQKILDLRPATVAAIDHQKGSPPLFYDVEKAVRAYDLPYRWARPRRALVLGAGTGNDVAAVLRHGAEHVDVVEIDPVILGFGKDLHPERPYQDPRVEVHVDDARAFLKRPGASYDTIVFGLLDAHLISFSSLASSIRLDNYVYTVESLRQALARLTPDGIIALSFAAGRPWVATRLERMIRSASGQAPLVMLTDYDGGVLYLTGPGVAGAGADSPAVMRGLSNDIVRAHPPGPLAVDDWPFLYLQGRVVPPVIVYSAVGILIAGAILVRLVFRGNLRFDRHLFFLGAGFLLVETRTIAQLGLLFGTTWRVSAITIAAILTLALLATLFVERYGALRRPPLYSALFTSLLLNYLISPGAALGSGTVIGGLMAGFYALPLLFAGLIFASSIDLREGGLAPALASNLMGSVLGGLLENVSMVVGFSGLSLLAIAVYAASFRR